MCILDLIEGLHDTFFGKGMKYLFEFKVKNTFFGGNEFNPNILFYVRINNSFDPVGYNK